MVLSLQFSFLVVKNFKGFPKSKTPFLRLRYMWEKIAWLNHVPYSLGYPNSVQKYPFVENKNCDASRVDRSTSTLLTMQRRSSKVTVLYGGIYFHLVVENFPKIHGEELGYFLRII